MKIDNKLGSISSKKESKFNIINKVIKVFDSDNLDIYLAILGSVVVGLLFYLYGRGGPNSSDITLYLNVGMNSIKEPFILNRYFHVFMQAIFVKLVDSPLEGYHLFWGFLMGVNTFAVYISSRKMFPKNTFLHGLLAVLIFYSIPAIGEIEGVVTVDVTAMTLVAVIFSIYVYSIKNGNRNPWFICALGFFIFLALKTKETTLPILILLIGLGWDDKDKFQIKRLIENLIWVICGMASGVVFFMLLNAIFLNDPLFGFRISDWQDYFATYISDSPYMIDAIQLGETNDWYKGYFLEFLFVPFILFVISGVSTYKKSTFPQKIQWVLPIILIGFVIISVNNRFGYMSRFIFPTLPIISICAAQFLDLDQSAIFNHKYKIYPALIVGAMLTIFIRYLMRLAIPEENLLAVLDLFYYPILFSLLLSFTILFRDKMYWNIVNLVIIFGLLFSPVITSYRNSFVYKFQNRRFNSLVLPFTEFEEHITFFPEMRFYVLDSSFRRAIDIAKNVDEFSVLFNVYFNANSVRENIVYQYEPRDVISDILAESYDYVLITNNVWEEMNQNEVGTESVLDQYRFYSDPDDRFVLLKPFTAP